MRKGRPILIEGRLRLDQWDDKQTGQKKSKLGVVAETVQFLGSPGEGGSGGGGGGAPAARPSRPAPAAPSAPPSEPMEGDGPPESDDVPF
jgi:single-strand DNA-binding protein